MEVIIIFLGLALGLLVAKLRGGQLLRLAEVRVKYVFPAIIALGIQAYVRMAGLKGWPLTPTAASWLFPVGFLMLLCVVVANRRLPGFLIIATGVAMNLVVIALNGGRMPVSPDALLATGLPLELLADPSRHMGHQLMDESMLVPWLGDIIPFRVPLLTRGPFAPTPMSPGDVVEIVGAFVFVQKVSRAGIRSVPPQQAEP